MSLVVRPARDADLAPLLSLLRLLDLPSEVPLSTEEASRRWQAMQANEWFCVYVAEEAGALVGTFSLTFIPGMPHGARDSCVVEDVVVARDRQGSGIGRQMMQFAMAACAKRRCYKLVLSSHVERVRAHRFYEDLGFARHGYSFLIEPTSAPGEAT